MLEIILAGLIQWQTIQTQIKEDNVSGIELSTYILHNDHNRDRINFIPGDSLWQIEERQRAERERVAQVSLRGESYTGAGSQVEIIGESWENCVQFAKRQTGITRSIGAGGRAGINSTEPKVGAIGAEKGVVHAVVVEKIEGDKITVIEANWYRGKITRRVLKRNDFIGFIT